MSTVATIISLISQKEITEQKFLSDLGFNRTLLSDWKSGKSKSFTKYLPEISAYFNVSTDYLLGNSDVKKETSPKGKVSRNPAIAEIDALLDEATPAQQELALRLLRELLASRGEGKNQ